MRFCVDNSGTLYGEKPMLFNRLKIGDYFTYDGKTYRLIPMIMKGCCSPQWNAEEANGEGYGYFHGELVIDPVSVVKCNIEAFPYLSVAFSDTNGYVVICDNTLPITVQKIRSKLYDKFVILEDTDTWAVALGLGEWREEHYYEAYPFDFRGRDS